jgi:hypothetical protein
MEIAIKDFHFSWNVMDVCVWMDDQWTRILVFNTLALKKRLFYERVKWERNLSIRGTACPIFETIGNLNFYSDISFPDNIGVASNPEKIGVGAIPN